MLRDRPRREHLAANQTDDHHDLALGAALLAAGPYWSPMA
jgi:hypothetical protein